MEEDANQPVSVQSAARNSCIFDILKNFIAKHKILDIIVLTAVIVIVGALFYFGKKEGIISRSEYVQAYTLVTDKVSQSAAIVVFLPEGMDKITAQNNVKFEPQIEGKWIDSELTDRAIFQPKQKPEIGKYYAVILQTDTVNITKEFLVDEDPKIEAVFPSADSEASEYSSVTIVFNRPMVPLTTLDILYEKDIPVEIIPATPGKFKWISTRNLQFIPETRLQRSSNYTVKIKGGLVSMDGLAVSAKDYNFKTRPLRYVDLQSGKTLYNQPLRIVFNQPVDLEKTKNEIRVQKLIGGKNLQIIGFGEEDTGIIVQYGSRSVYNQTTKKNEELVDKSILEIYSAKDRFGREKFWDFNTNYNLQITKAYPSEGDIILNEKRNVSFYVPEIIESLSATSERSKYVEPDLFDPQGKLGVRFYENINLSSIKINAKGLKEIRYGEKCKTDEEGEVIYQGGECEKEEDKSLIYISFHQDVFGRSENIPIEFEKVYNTEGLKINAEPIVKTITTYPDIKITRTKPVEGQNDASLTNLIICSNTPLTPKGNENYKEAIITNSYLAFNNWSNPYRLKQPNSYGPCSAGEFVNQIRYGLVPESPYTLNLKMKDDFDQRAEKTISFTTAKPESFYLRFHNLQKIYNVTTPEKTRLTYATENMEYVNLHICKTSAKTILDYLTQEGIDRTLPPSVENCEIVKQDRIELPKRYWVNNYFQTNLKDYFPNALGHYVLTFSHPDYAQKVYDRNTKNYTNQQIYERTYVSVTQLAVGEKRVRWEAGKYYNDPAPEITQKAIGQSDQNLYWVSKIGTLEPVNGATIALYEKSSSEETTSFAGSYITGIDGLARGPAVKDVAGVIITSGNDSTIVSDWADKLYYTSNSLSASKTYIYTDRPIYRPGDEIFIKGIYRIGYDGDYEIFRGKNADVKVYSGGYKGDLVYEGKIPINDFGTFNTSFKLAQDAPLGSYRIEAFGTNNYFDVEEYVPAAFKADAASDKEEYIAGDTFKMTIDANYYFGVPVDGGEVNYSVTTQDYYFDRYEDEYFNFGGDWYYCYDCGYGDDFLFRGKAILGKDGRAQISKKIDFNEFFKDPEKAKSKIFVFHATVKDSSGRSVSAEKSFIVHDGEFYLGVKTDKSFFGKNETFKVRAKTVDIQGQEVSKNNIALEINKITWQTFKRREVDGGFYYQWEEKKQLITKETINTDKNGNWQKDFSLTEEGEYKISFWGNDSRGNFLKTETSVYVYGKGQVSIKPTNNYTLEIETEKQDVEVGDKPKIIIKSPYNKAKALVTVDRGQVFDYWLLDIDRNLYDIDIPIKEAYIPNVFVSVLLLSAEPEIKFGQLEFNVNRSHYVLNIDVKSDKNFYLPGEEVKLKVKTTNYLNQPVSAEVSIGVADLSVLALKGNPKKNPLVFFYDGFPLTVTTASNIKNILYEIEIPLGTKGGGGAEPEDLAKKQRGIFKDTAFWQAAVQTGSDGRASISFTLPDNLTTWQIETVGVTRDTLLGTDYDEFTARKNLMVVPLKPRFAVPGDEFLVGAKIFNQTGKKQKLDVSFASQTLSLKDDGQKSIAIDSEKTDTVYFSVSAPANYSEGKHIFVLSAKNSDYEDTVQNSISITRNDTYEAVATANFTKTDISKEYIYAPEDILKDKGGLTIKSNATMAVFLSDALNYLVSYPYGCSEQIASKLSSIAIVKRGLNIKNVGEAFKLKDIEFEGKTYSIDEVVKIGLTRIYENQSSSGGFTYYRRLEPNFYLTLHILNTLEDLRLAGFDISESVIASAANYVYRSITQDYRLYQNKDTVILSAYVLSRLDNFSFQNDALKSQVISLINDERFINEQISSIAFSQLAIIAVKENYSAVLKNKVFKILENRIDIDSRGAYLKGRVTNIIRGYYETPVKNTAYLLKALVADKNEHVLLDKIIRWLLKSRNKDGAWGSTNNTLSVVEAFTDFLEWQRETESEFLLNVKLNNKDIANFDFNKNTVLETFETFIPMADLSFSQMNTLVFNRANKNNLKNNFYYDISFKYFLPIDKIPPRDEGITIAREFYRLDDEKMEHPLIQARLGDVLVGRITVTIPKARNFLSVEDFIPAGFELVNFGLETENQTLKSGGMGKIEKPGLLAPQKFAGLASIFNAIGSQFNLPALTFRAESGETGDWFVYQDEMKNRTIDLRPDFEEIHDDRLFLFKEIIDPGVYTYDYYIRALTPGKFHHLPAVASEMYFPENFGRTSGSYFTVESQ